MEITRPHTEVSKMRCQGMKINFWNYFFQDIWRTLPFPARKIYRESFSLVKLELLSTRTRIRIKLPRSQITRLSPKNGTQVLVLHALPNIWSGQPRNRLKPWVCEARISRRLIHSSLLILKACLKFWSSDYVPRGKIIFINITTASHIVGSQQSEWHSPFEDTPENAWYELSLPS